MIQLFSGARPGCPEMTVGPESVKVLLFLEVILLDCKMPDFHAFVFLLILYLKIVLA